MQQHLKSNANMYSSINIALKKIICVFCTTIIYSLYIATIDCGL